LMKMASSTTLTGPKVRQPPRAFFAVGSAQVMERAAVSAAPRHTSWGALGRDKLFCQLLWDYWWPTLYKSVEQWVKLCKTCQEHSNLHGRTAARKMGMDLIGPLPKSF